MTNPLWSDRVRSLKERLQKPLMWFPFPALIAFGLVIVLRGHLFSGFNHRLGTEASVIELNSEPLRSPGIWMSITQSGNDILIVMDDHQQFRVPLATPNIEALNPLIKRLKERARTNAFKTSLDLTVDIDRIRVVLAVDQKLKFIHLRPILYALAEAKISNYGFETRIISAVEQPSHQTAGHGEEHL